MIETQEQWNVFQQFKGDAILGGAFPMKVADAIETIEALREVARAGRNLSEDEESGESGWGPDVTMLIPLNKALDALPDWLTK